MRPSVVAIVVFASAQIFLATATAESTPCESVKTWLGMVTSKNKNSINKLESAKYAFDANINTKWMDYQGHKGDVWIEYTHPLAVAVTQYSIVSGNDAQDRDPSSWILSGSNDGKYYVELDRRKPKQPLFTERNQKRSFDLDHSSAFRYYKFLFLSVRDNSKKNGLQIAELELHTGKCTKVCCAVTCAETGSCVDGKCVCKAGYSGPDCATKDLLWATFPNRAFVSNPIAKMKLKSLDECKEMCGGKYKQSCAGVSMSNSGECCVHGGKGDMKSSSSGTAHLLVGKNLLSPIKTRLESPRESKVHRIKWDRTGANANNAMPSFSVFRGETVIFEWVDPNSYYGYLTGLGPKEGRGPHGEDRPNHHSITQFPTRDDFVRCDFRGTSNADLVGSYPIVHWVAREPGTYFFGSSFTDANHKDANGKADPINDCKSELKIMITVERRM